jgi:dihydroneopterin aldolase/2-amino-4-hydroxy-6-hydroxymethyldihydropteridine diphosphokinase/dihydropteroate synthase
MSDYININDLSIHLIHGLGPSAFNLSPPPPCPIVLSIRITLTPDVVPHCTQHDNMPGLGVNYSSTSKEVIALLGGDSVWSSPNEVIIAVGKAILENPSAEGVDIELVLPRALLLAESAVYRATVTRQGIENARYESRQIKVACIIGLHPHERERKQRLELDIAVLGLLGKEWDHRAFTEMAYEVGDSALQTFDAADICSGSKLPAMERWRAW